MTIGLQTLKTRPEFLRLRGGFRARTPLFVVEGRPRTSRSRTDTQHRAVTVPSDAANDEIVGPRFGFTVTKKIGNAVARNKIRRRLKEAVRKLDPSDIDANFDYVIVAYDGAATARFSDLSAALSEALTALRKRATAQKRPSAASARHKPTESR